MSTASAPQWWDALRHGGLLISPPRLAEFFSEPPPRMANYVADRLRALLTRAASAGSLDARLRSDFVDSVLREVCRLDETQSFRTLATVDATWSRESLTGETIRPRRIITGPHGSTVPVFVDDSPRIGVGNGRRAVSRALEWLRAAEHRIGVVTNGLQWRLVYAGADYDAWAEWDTALWFEGGAPGPQVEAIRTLLSPASLTPAAKGERTPLLAAIEESRKGQAELSAVLGERVRLAVETLIQSHGGAFAKHPDRFTPRDIYLAATRVVMRMVVVLFAEARDLLPRENALYYDSYGLQGLRDQLERAGAERRKHGHGAWPRVIALFRLVHDGSHHEALPILRYGGGLFRPGDAASEDPIARALAILESTEHAPTDDVVANVLALLCRTKVKVRQGRGSTWVQAPVDFSDLSSEYIGILYEGLLDFELRQASADDPIVFLGVGDEPALPLSRLEKMDGPALKNLLGKFKQKKAEPAEGEDDEGEDEDAGPEASASAEASDDASPDDLDADPTPSITPSIAGSDEASRVASRADAWARRAVVAGGLVAKTKGKKADAGAQYEREVAVRAKQLIRRVVLPGEWFLVRWGGTRKGAGTFYTRPQLAVPTVQRTLRPLLFDPPAGPDGAPDENAPFASWTPKLPEQILAVRVCDPAMGSGSFLVASLRFITDALFASLHVHRRIAARGTDTVFTLPEGRAADGRLREETLPRRPDDEHFESQLRARLKRHVVLRCLYGVDLDGLAVELARLSLWIETMDRSLPFEFIKHRLKRGNALVGCWFDRYRHYPVLAWEREGGDAKHENGVHFTKKARTEAIKEFKQKTVYPALLDWLSGQQRLSIDAPPGVSPSTLKADVQRALESMAALPLHDPDERERVYEENVEHNPAFLALRERFDAWCALWFWPVDRLDRAPLPGAPDTLSPDAREIVRGLRNEYGFFHWELEFPDVFTGEQSGFEAVLGNPPWDIQKPKSQEFFSNVDPLYRTYGKQEALKHQAGYFLSGKPQETAWLEYNARFNALTNWCRAVGSPFGDGERDGKTVSLGRGNAGSEGLKAWGRARARDATFAQREHPFLHQGGGDANTYKLFLEQVFAVLAQRGAMGMIVPSGIYSDKGTGELRALFLERAAWNFLYAFQNERFVFEGIDHRFKMVVINVVKGGRTDAVRARFRLGPGDSPETQEIESDLLANSGYLPMTVKTIERFSPRTRSLLEIRTQRDLEVLEKIYANSVLLGDDGPDGWGIKYATEFHMTNDSKLFPPRPKWEADGYRADEYGRWVKPRRVVKSVQEPVEAGWIRLADGDGWVNEEDIEGVALPVYEGRMIDQFRFTSKGWVSGRGRTAVWRDIEVGAAAVEPQFLMSQESYLSNGGTRRSKLTFMDVTASTNERTFIGTVLAGVPCGHKTPTFTSKTSNEEVVFAGLAAANSFWFDSTLRVRLGGTSLVLAVLQESPLPRAGGVAIAKAGSLAASLALTTVSFSVEWLRIGDRHKPWRAGWASSTSERVRLRSMLDALVATSFGLTRDDVFWALRDCDYPAAIACNPMKARAFEPKGFWRAEKELDPELRHTVLTQIAFHELQRTIAENGGDRDAGIAAFCAQNDGDGWMLPETLCLADYGLGHDERAKVAQPVASRLGPRFYEWQLGQNVEESWAECERHARNLLGAEGFARLKAEIAGGAEAKGEGRVSGTRPKDLFGEPVATDLFGNVVGGRKKKSRL